MELSKYDSLNYGANLMNFYASKVESSSKLAKDKMTRLIALFKEAFANRPIENGESQVRSGGQREYLNIIKDPMVVKTEGSSYQRGQRDCVLQMLL